MPSTTEELIKIILSVDGEEGIKSLEQSLHSNSAAVDKLKQDFAAGNITFEQFIANSKKLAATGAELQRYYDQMHAGQEQVQTGSKLSADGLLKLGNTLDDLQYVGEMGLRPIINNVIQIAPAIGIALIAAEMLRKRFGEELAEAIGISTKAIETADEKIKKLKETIEEIEKKPFKLGVDFTQLDKARADLADLEERERNREAAGGDATSQAYKADIAKTVRESLGGEKNLTATLTAIEKQTGYQHADPKLLEEAKALEDFIRNPISDEFGRMIRGGAEDEDRLKAVRRQIEDSAGEYVKRSIVDPFLAGDERGISIVKNMVGANPGAFSKQGITGLTGVEAVGALPTNMDDFLRQKAIDREIAMTDQESQGLDAQWKQTKAKRAAAAKEKKAALKRSQAETEAEDRALDKFVDDQLPAAQKKAEKKQKAEALRQDKARRDNMAFIAAQRKADLQRQREAALNPESAAVQQLTPRATEHLRRSGFGRQEAEAYAPQLAQALLRGADLNIATQQLAMQMLTAINSANVRQRQAEQMLRMNQMNMARMRMRMPSTQPVPFTN